MPEPAECRAVPWLYNAFTVWYHYPYLYHTEPT